MWPLSLLAFRAAALGLALDRNPKTVEDAMLHRISSNTCSVHSKQTTGVESSNAGILQDEKPTIRSKITSGQHELLEHCYRRHVKPKKQHEILYLSKVMVYSHCQYNDNYIKKVTVDVSGTLPISVMNRLDSLPTLIISWTTIVNFS